MDRETESEVDIKLVAELLREDVLAIDCSGRVNIVALQCSGARCGDGFETRSSLGVSSKAVDAELGKSILLRRLGSGSDELDLLSANVNELVGLANEEGRRLSAIVVGQGPGSFTGLRIATALAQGLAFGLKIPLIEISSFSLANFAVRLFSENGEGEISQNKESELSSAIVRSAGKGSWFYSESGRREEEEERGGSHKIGARNKADRSLKSSSQCRIELLTDEQLINRGAKYQASTSVARVYGFEEEQCSLLATTPISSQVYGENIFRAIREECKKKLNSKQLVANSQQDFESPILIPDICLHPWDDLQKATPLYLRPVAAKSLKDRGLS